MPSPKVRYTCPKCSKTYKVPQSHKDAPECGRCRRERKLIAAEREFAEEERLRAIAEEQAEREAVEQAEREAEEEAERLALVERERLEHEEYLDEELDFDPDEDVPGYRDTQPAAERNDQPPEYEGLRTVSSFHIGIGVMTIVLSLLGILVGVAVIDSRFSAAMACFVGGACGLLSGLSIIGLGHAYAALRDIARNSYNRR